MVCVSPVLRLLGVGELPVLSAFRRAIIVFAAEYIWSSADATLFVRGKVVVAFLSLHKTDAIAVHESPRGK